VTGIMILRNARFRRLLIGETVSSFGDSAMYLSLAIWAKELTGSDASAGLVFLFLTVPGLGSPVMGYLVDRVNRKPLLLWMYGGMALIVLSLLMVRTTDQLPSRRCRDLRGMGRGIPGPGRRHDVCGGHGDAGLHQSDRIAARSLRRAVPYPDRRRIPLHPPGAAAVPADGGDRRFHARRRTARERGLRRH
jgi:hypothetical protein